MFDELCKYDYGLLVIQKNRLQSSYSANLKYNSDFKTITIYSKDFILLHLIDYNNYDQEIYSKEECEKVLEELKKFEKNTESVITLTREELKNLVESYDNKRLPASINKEVCIPLALDNNKQYIKYPENKKPQNDRERTQMALSHANTIDMDTLTTILDNIIANENPSD